MKTPDLNSVFRKLETESIENRFWVAKAIFGIIVADGVIHEREESYLEKMFDLFEEHKVYTSELKQIMDQREAPELEETELSPDNRYLVFKFILEIAAVDSEVHHKELSFLWKVARMMNLDKIQTLHYIDNRILKMNVDTYGNLMSGMSDLHQEWMRNAILKVIFADNYLHENQLSLFSDIFEVGQTRELVSQVQTGQIKLELPEIEFEQDRALKFIQYLLIVATIDKAFNQKELDSIRSIAELIHIDDERFDQTVKSVLNIMNLKLSESRTGLQEDTFSPI